MKKVVVIAAHAALNVIVVGCKSVEVERRAACMAREAHQRGNPQRGEMMNDEELQKMMDELFAGTRSIRDLTDGEFVQVLDGLSRVFCARVFNCIDPHGKKDPEWRMLSDAFSRAKDRCSLCR